jgi:hypothetical protein
MVPLRRGGSLATACPGAPDASGSGYFKRLAELLPGFDTDGGERRPDELAEGAMLTYAGLDREP